MGNAWSPKPRSTRPRMMPTATVSNLRTRSRTTATPSRDRSVVTKLPPRWTLLTRPLWKARLRRLSAGSTATLPQRRKNTKKQKELEGVAMPILQKMGGAAGAGGMPGGMPDMGAAGGAPPADADPAGGPTIEEID